MMNNLFSSHLQTPECSLTLQSSSLKTFFSLLLCLQTHSSRTSSSTMATYKSIFILTSSNPLIPLFLSATLLSLSPLILCNKSSHLISLSLPQQVLIPAMLYLPLYVDLCHWERGWQQDSNSEAVNIYYSAALMGLAYGDLHLASIGSTLASLEIHAAKMWWHVKEGDNLYEDDFAKDNKLVGYLAANHRLDLIRCYQRPCEVVTISVYSRRRMDGVCVCT
nr:uncharacterized protein LOC112744709 isoform X3 [Arachis hypogaea]